MSQINANQPWHPVEHLAFWQTKSAEIKEMAAVYDLLVADDPAKKELLDKLIAWACQEASADAAYNMGEG